MQLDAFRFVVAASQEAVLQRCLMDSPLWKEGAHAPTVVWNANSAAAAFNPVMGRLEDARVVQGTGQQSSGRAEQASVDDGIVEWLVWVHQDVRLPAGWQHQWLSQVRTALVDWPRLAVVGVYGLWETGVAGAAVRAGHVVDRGMPLREPANLPHPATSLDELLVAVRVGSGLRFDESLGFDFYATDICLQARERGLDCAVLDACCEHHSSTPRGGPMPRQLIERIRRNGECFERKWAQRLPLSTSCFDIRRPGDVAAFLAAHTTPVDGG